MKHDIAAVASHKTKQCNKFSFSTNVCHGLCGGSGSKFVPLYTSTLLLDRVSQKNLLFEISREIHRKINLQNRSRVLIIKLIDFIF